MPECLVHMLLLMAGIESNPGPKDPEPDYYCPVCQIKLPSNSWSVSCCKCNKYVHFRKTKNNNCSRLVGINKWTEEYICPACETPPVITNPTPPVITNSTPPVITNLPNQTTPPVPPANPPPDPPPPQSTSPPSPPTPAPPKRHKFKILQLNCNGLKGKIDEIVKWLIKEDVKIAAFQETKLHEDSKLSDIPHYTLVREDRKKGKGGGLAFLVHTSIQFTLLDSYKADLHLEHQAIKVENLTLVNLYIPPKSSCSTGYKSVLTPIFPQEDALIVGDINAHDLLWSSTIEDDRGKDFSQEIGDSNLGVLNTDTPTRLPSNGQTTSPDISLASLSILPYAQWETHTTFGSDHLPILITLDSRSSPARTELLLNLKRQIGPNLKKIQKKNFQNYSLQLMFIKVKKCLEKLLTKLPKFASPRVGSRISSQRCPQQW